MSYNLFRTELKSKLYKQHDSKTKFASTLATAYDKFVNRHFDTMTGGGKPIGSSARIPMLQQGFQIMFTKNLFSEGRINFFSQMAPFFKAYWAGMVITGPTGIVVVTGTGFFQGPIVIENNSIDIFLNILQGCVAVHMMTMFGTYTNYYTGLTFPWTSALLLTTP